jgi:iron(III) transport system ATP-binding protein
VLSVEGLAKAFGDGAQRVHAVRGIAIEVPEGGFCTLLGPSGSGKTTVLRCVAGLERADAGVISLAGRVVSDPAHGVHVPPDRRGVGMVFQSPTVWPHMTVRRNVAFPLLATRRTGRISRGEAARRTDEALAMVRLAGLGGRAASDLSGGQQQRLALARAIAGAPRTLLLDEPLAALDEQLRADLRGELRRIQTELGVTTLYVTHDQEEALSLSSLVAVVHGGLVVQAGTPREVYERPATAFVASLVGAANLVPGVVDARDDGVLVVRTRHGALRVPHDDRFRRGADVLVVARPEHLVLEPGGDARVASQTYLGDAVEHVVALAAGEVRARTAAHEALAPGTAVTVRFHGERLALVPPEPDDAR